MTINDFILKWNIRFATNDTFEIDEADLREFKDDVAMFLAAGPGGSPGLSELVLPQPVLADALYLTGTAIWAARSSFNAAAPPQPGPNWRLVADLRPALTAASITDASAAGRSLLTAASASVQLGLLDVLDIKAGQEGNHPAFTRAYQPDGLLLFLLRKVMQPVVAPVASAPAAPTDGQVDDQGDSFSFLPTVPNPSFAQYMVAGLPNTTGAEWLSAANSYVQRGRIYVRVVGAVPAGGLAVFVGASGSITAGQVLTNADPFTASNVPTTPGALAVDFAVDNASLSPGDTLTFTAKAKGGTAPYQHSVQALNVDTGTVTVLGTANTANYTGAWQQVPDGVYLVTDAVTDAAGGSLVSATRRIVIAAPGTGGGALVPATRTRLGGVRVGDGLDVEPDGELSAQVQLQKVNIWQQVGDYSAKGLKLPVGGFIDEAGHLFIRQVDVGQRHFTFGRYYSLARESIIQWKSDEYVNQDGNGDVGLARVGPGVLEVNTGTAGQRATLRVLDVVADSAPASLNSIQKLAANKADLGPDGRVPVAQSRDVGNGLMVNPATGNYELDDQALYYYRPTQGGKRVNPANGAVTNVSGYELTQSVQTTPPDKSYVTPGQRYQSNVPLFYAAWYNSFDQYVGPWSASSTDASYFSVAPAGANYLKFSLAAGKIDGPPVLRITPNVSTYDDTALNGRVTALEARGGRWRGVWTNAAATFNRYDWVLQNSILYYANASFSQVAGATFDASSWTVFDTVLTPLRFLGAPANQNLYAGNWAASGNSVGSGTVRNTFWDAISVTFGLNCVGNTVGQGAQDISLGDGGRYNQIGGFAVSISLGSSNVGNSVAMGTVGITSAASVVYCQVRDSTRYVYFAQGCQYCVVEQNSQYVEFGANCQRVTVRNTQGVSGTSFKVPAGTTDAVYLNGVLQTPSSGGGGGGVTPQQLEAVRSTVVIGATISGDTTLGLSAAGALLPVSTNSTITVPANADVPFGVGVVLELVPTTGAMPLVAAAAGVTILAATGNRGAGQGSPLRLTQLAADFWLLTGGA